MTQNRPVGIDLSKGWPDLAVADEVERIDNAAPAILAQIARLGKSGSTTVGVEPTGGCERRAVSLFREAGFIVLMVDSWRCRRFGKAGGRRAKTDPLDARPIADVLVAHQGRPSGHALPTAQRPARGADPAVARDRPGVAAYPHDSGKSRGGSHIDAGRRALRRALDLAAFAAKLHNPCAKAVYDGLRKAGKPAKAALIARQTHPRRPQRHGPRQKTLETQRENRMNMTVAPLRCARKDGGVA